MKNKKRNLTSSAFLVAAFIAVFSIAYGYSKNINKDNHNTQTIEENFLIQNSEDNFVRALTAPNSCGGTATLNCKYSITELGKENIPESQSSYDENEVQDFLDMDYIEPVSGSGPGLYQ